ncbi:MAG: hypothetical protein INR62_02395, partial [Rhodospirillales bacterium]|nr:hypothetical protein [Acetobacter sp.]
MLRQVVGLRREHQIEENFEIILLGDKACEIYLRGVASNGTPNRSELSEGSEINFVSLINANCLRSVSTAKPSWSGWRAYALTTLGMHALETNFADDSPRPQPSTHTNNFHAAVFGAQFGNN